VQLIVQSIKMGPLKTSKIPFNSLGNKEKKVVILVVFNSNILPKFQPNL
jgi:hypothetical protein